LLIDLRRRVTTHGYEHRRDDLPSPLWHRFTHDAGANVRGQAAE
jgi:hypothetical protein